MQNVSMSGLLSSSFKTFLALMLVVTSALMLRLPNSQVFAQVGQQCKDGNTTTAIVSSSVSSEGFRDTLSADIRYDFSIGHYPGASITSVTMGNNAIGDFFSLHISEDGKTAVGYVNLRSRLTSAFTDPGVSTWTTLLNATGSSSLALSAVTGSPYIGGIIADEWANKNMSSLLGHMSICVSSGIQFAGGSADHTAAAPTLAVPTAVSHVGTAVSYTAPTTTAYSTPVYTAPTYSYTQLTPSQPGVSCYSYGYNCSTTSSYSYTAPTYSYSTPSYSYAPSYSYTAPTYSYSTPSYNYGSYSSGSSYGFSW